MNKYILNAKIALTVILISVCFLRVEAQVAHSRGVIAPPQIKTLTQTDGTTIKLYIKGDGLVHWFETIDKEKVLLNQDGSYMYAKLDKEGRMIASKDAVKPKKSFIKALFSKKEIKRDINIFFSKKQLQQKVSKYIEDDNTSRSYVQRESSKSQREKSFPTSGKRKMLTILAEFSDQDHKISRQTLDDIMNKRNYNNTGSFRDYFLEASYNSLDITTTVSQWIRLPHTKAYYGKNDSDYEDTNPREFIRDAITAALEAGIDFSPFDNDKDGYIDFLQVIHSGVGEEGGEDADAMWSHQWSLKSDFHVGNNIYAREYVTSPELFTNKDNTPSSIGVMCHEFGHALGLKDYYDTDYGDSGGYSEGLSYWELMDSGCWNNDGKTPAHTNIYSKYILGWINLPELNQSGIYEITPSEENKAGYQIKTNKEEEFFVLENRQQIGFDEYIPYHGLLIYRINRSNPGWEDNKINIDPKKEGFKLLKSKSYNKDCPFPGKGEITSITDKTSPSSLRTSTLDYTYKGLLGIKEEEGLISFNYYHNNRLNHNVQFQIISENTGVNEAHINLIRKDNSSLTVSPQTTDKEGLAYFDEVSSGSYILEIDKEGYKQYTEEISIYRDKIINIELIKNYKLTINIASKDTPIENVEVSIKSEDTNLSEYTALTTDYNGKVIFEDIKLGTYIVSAKKYNYKTIEKTINVDSELIKTINFTPYDIIDAKKNNIKIYPNPSYGEVNLDIELSGEAIIRVIDMRGKQVYQERHAGGILNTINLSNLSTGIYKFVIIDKGTMISKTLIINK